MYRGPRGLMCAIGVLINDDDYDLDFEGNDIFGLIEESDLIVGGDISYLKAVDIEFLSDLQSIHDNHAPLAWRRELKKLGTLYGLDRSFL